MRNETERPFDAMQIQCSFILTNKWKFNGFQYSNDEVGKVTIRAHMALVCIMTQAKLSTDCRSMYKTVLKHAVNCWVLKTLRYNFSSANENTHMHQYVKSACTKSFEFQIVGMNAR